MDYSAASSGAGPSTHDQPAWPPAKRALGSDAEGDGGETEEDEGGGTGKGNEAPKKRRRRQALSCTECKRRKIKCDRQHPCGPCARRSEADKCHWNVVEPADKPTAGDGRSDARRSFSPDRAPCQSRSQPLLPPDAGGKRIARLEAFLASSMPDVWARFQHEDDGSSPNLPSLAGPRRLGRSEDHRSSLSGRSLFGVSAPPSESSTNVSRDNTLPRFQPFSSPQPPPQAHQEQQYARPLLPRGSSAEHFPPTPAPSVGRFDGPLPGPRALGFAPGFGGPKSEASGSSRFGDWDAHLSRVLPPPLPSPRSRVSGGTSASSTVFSEGRRTSDPNPFGKYDGPGNDKPPGSGHGRADDPSSPHIFVSFTMAGDSTERDLLLASLFGKSEAALERGALPDRTTCDLLVDHYFKRVAWNHNLIHPESFLESYRTFWTVPTEKRRAPFVALLLVVLCVSLGNMSPERAIRERVCKDMVHRQQLCLGFWKGCQKALGASNMVKSKDLEVIQALVMLMYCDQSLDDNGWEYYTPFIGLAVRLAHGMGLSKLGSEPVGQVPAPGLLEREVKRRVWWNLVFLDWYLSPMGGNTYLIHPGQMTTSPPTNADWSELRDGVQFEPQERKNYTTASFLITKTELAASVRELTDHINAGQAITCDFLLAYERRMSDRWALSPQALFRRDHVLERDERVAWERLMVTFGLNHRAIRLHRRFMLRGYAVLEFRRSTESCISAAKTVLHTFQEAQSIDFPGTTWWVVCMISYVAAVVLLMDQFYSRTAIGGELPAPAEMELRRRYIHQAIQLLYAISEISGLAKRGAHVLSALLEEVGRRRGIGPLDVHPSPYANAPPGGLGRLVSLGTGGGDRFLENWVSEGLGREPSSIPDGELQSAPVGARGLNAETEAFWTKVFELDFPVESSQS
ncbi:Fungal specific transcription factor domain [Ceratobasidium sp. AG-Ba]|nr:Fungal specific transcription factor domain [Ceratobasidium sp. AG-Ba]